MNCKEALDLIHAHIDGELDLAKSLEIEQHLAGCAACKVQYDSLHEAASSLRAHANYHAAPASLRARIGASLPREVNATPLVVPGGWARRFAPLAFAFLALAAVFPWLLRPGTDERVAQEVVAGHVRSMLGEHLTDVASSDQHTVKPWIAHKLDFSPPVPDLSARGFVLAGGRLDYFDQRKALALVYRHRLHVINLFVWPEEQSGPLLQVNLRGFNVAHFAHGGMAYWAVSDLNAEELKGFADLLRADAGGAR